MIMSGTDLKENQIVNGTIWKQILIFFFPIALGTIFQQIYNMADTIIVGRFLGTEALASVGGTASVVTYQIIMIFTGLSSGATVIISQCFGAGDSERLHRGLHTAFAFAIITSIFISIVGWIASPWILEVTQTPAEIMDHSITYLRIYFLGVLATFLYNMGSSIMRAIGDSKRPLYYLIVCSILNIVLDLVFIIVFKMGIAGAATATIISQAVSAVLIIRSLCKDYKLLKLELGKIRIHMPLLKAELRIGLPACVQTIMYGITNIVIQTFINSFDTTTVAAWAVLGKVDVIFWAVNGAFGIAVTTFCGQNFGAGKMERVYRSVRTSLMMALFVGGSLLGTLALLAQPIFGLFTRDAAVVEIGVYMLLFMIPSYIVYIFVEIFTGALRGVGDVMIPTIITLCGVGLVRLPWLLIMTPIRRELSTVMISYPLAWAATALFMVPYYFYRKKKGFRKMQKGL